jgi:hypothetical protein
MGEEKILDACDGVGRRPAEETVTMRCVAQRDASAVEGWGACRHGRRRTTPGAARCASAQRGTEGASAILTRYLQARVVRPTHGRPSRA